MPPSAYVSFFTSKKLIARKKKAYFNVLLTRQQETGMCFSNNINA